MGSSSCKNIPKVPKEKIINEKTKLKPNSDNKNLIEEKDIEKLKNIEVVNLIKTVKSKFI